MSKKALISQKTKDILVNGISKQNPLIVMLLGLCPIMVATESLDNAIGMSAAVLFVLLFSNIIVSAIRKLVPSEIRIPVYIVIIASLVTIVDMLMKAFTPELSNSLGVFIPLITVNCIILGRAEAFASKNTIKDSILDALGMACGFAIVCIIMAILREFLGTGGLKFSNPFTGGVIFSVQPLASFAIPFFVQGPGAFLMLGFIIALYQYISSVREARKTRKSVAMKGAN